MRILHVVMICCFYTSTVPLGSPLSTTTLQTEAETLPKGSFESSSDPSPAASTLPITEDTTSQPTATKLKDTTVVIIVSVSLALLVFAIIPLILYRRSSRSAGGRSKSEFDYCEDAASSPASVRLQSLQSDADPEPSIHDASQYAAVYQALDPKPLD